MLPFCHGFWISLYTQIIIITIIIHIMVILITWIHLLGDELGAPVFAALFSRSLVHCSPWMSLCTTSRATLGTSMLGQWPPSSFWECTIIQLLWQRCPPPWRPWWRECMKWLTRRCKVTDCNPVTFEGISSLFTWDLIYVTINLLSKMAQRVFANVANMTLSFLLQDGELMSILEWIVWKGILLNSQICFLPVT